MLMYGTEHRGAKITITLEADEKVGGVALRMVAAGTSVRGRVARPPRAGATLPVGWSLTTPSGSAVPSSGTAAPRN